MNYYKYEGPIVLIDSMVVSNIWSAKTWAATEKKAMNNFKFQAKRALGLVTTAKVKLPGKITVIQED